MRSSLCLGALLVVLSCLAWPRAAGAADAANEGQVKAAFVFNAMRYVDWPEGVPGAAAAVTVCRAGNGTPFTQALSALEGRSLRGVPIRVRTVATEAAGCQVLVLPEGEGEALLNRVQGQPVLTVGEGWGFLEDSGILAVAVLEGKLVFGANLDAARRANLRLSAQLLKLARRVVDAGGR